MTDVPEIYVSQLTHYLAATSAPQADRAVAKIRSQLATPYEFWKDPYGPVQNRLLRDRRGSRDGQELVELAEGAPASRKASYTLAAEGWARLAPWWDGLQHERLPNQRVQVGDLAVVVPRLCAERHPDGQLEVLYVRFNKGDLPLYTIFGVMRIVQRAHPETTSTFVDVRRGAVHTSKGRDLTVYDEWLTEAGNDLAKLLDAGQDQAAAA
ncbi:hypothetical protein ACO229_06915 [Promicromonospora sp. MS192]|uniref:hypothetical protein n=1 Tax=Promicromonospora sp. MS192 TaxID=3412684 RepID=UPI003C2B6FD2